MSRSSERTTTNDRLVHPVFIRYTEASLRLYAAPHRHDLSKRVILATTDSSDSMCRWTWRVDQQRRCDHASLQQILSSFCNIANYSASETASSQSLGERIAPDYKQTGCALRLHRPRLNGCCPSNRCLIQSATLLSGIIIINCRLYIELALMTKSEWIEQHNEVLHGC